MKFYIVMHSKTTTACIYVCGFVYTSDDWVTHTINMFHITIYIGDHISHIFKVYAFVRDVINVMAGIVNILG